jgi:S-adenosylmethionine-dependent methyltransferase
MTTHPEADRFQSGADQYAAYLNSPEGRLRIDLAFANLQDFLPVSADRLLALDLGCGTGAIAVRLAQLGIHLTLLDSSLPMLELADRAARQGQVTDRITLKHGDATQLEKFSPASFDVILCHNLLEFVSEPCTVLRSAARLLRDSSSILSILVRNQAGEVLKAALQSGDLTSAAHHLTAEWGQESLYGGSVRLFSPASLLEMLADASLLPIEARGVRVLSDYLPSKISRAAEYDRIFDLERKLGKRPDFAAIARYTHCLAHRPDPSPDQSFVKDPLVNNPPADDRP